MFSLEGSMVALVTPMESDGSISWEYLYDLIDWHIDSGTSGIVVVGTTGESSTIDVSEHIQIIEKSVQHSNNRIPVIAGTGANSTKEAMYLTSAAEQAGANAALLVTPYYNKPTQKGLIAHYSDIASKVNLPQILYNVPSRTACDLLPESVAILSEIDNIIGLKEATPESSRIDDLKESLKKCSGEKKFFLYSGDDLTSTEFILRGGHGIISVSANVVPTRVAKVCNLALKNNSEQAKIIDLELRALHKVLFIESSPIPVKWVLNRMGKIPEGIRLPLSWLSSSYYEEIELILKKLRLI